MKKRVTKAELKKQLNCVEMIKIKTEEKEFYRIIGYMFGIICFLLGVIFFMLSK